MIVYLDGEYLDADEAGIAVSDRGFLFSDGVFETALLRHGVYYHLTSHLERLCASAWTMGIADPDVASLTQIATELAQRNRLADGSLRITLTAGAQQGERGTVLVTLAPVDARWVERARNGWSIITAETRRPSTRAVPSQLKALGRTYALLARREARTANVDDALLLTDDGLVCEGPTWNVFWRIGDTLFTPQPDLGVLVGITRTILISKADAAGYRVEQVAHPREVLDRADEVFATMTSVGIARITTLDGRALPAETPAADALYRIYWDEVDRWCDAHRE